MGIVLWFVCFLLVWWLKGQLGLTQWVWWVFGILTVLGIIKIASDEMEKN